MIKDLLQEKNLDLYLDYFKQSKKNYMTLKWTFTVLFFILYSTGVMFTQRYVFFLGLPVVVLFVNKYFYFNFVLRKKQSDLLKTYLFPEFLRYFRCLLGTSGNVYTTLQATVPYVKEPLKTELRVLIQKLERKNERNPYMEFADVIGSSDANMVMSMIYEFAEFGICKEAIQELEQFIEKLHENKTNELIKKKVHQMDIYSVPSLLLAVFFVFSFAGVLFVYYMSQVTGMLTF